MRLSRLALPLAAAVTAALLVPSLTGSRPAGAAQSRAAVNVDQVYKVPASRTFTVTGRGYGHGRGMSQYGAEGAAREGLTHEQILAFYYPGTELSKAKGRIRVLITADTTSDVVVVARPKLKVYDAGSSTVHRLPANGAGQWRLRVTNANRNVVEHLSGGTWKRWRTLEGEGVFRAPGGITLVTPSGRTTYRGWLHAAAPSAGSRDRDTVNVLPLDGYVKGVVAREIPASWSPEAVQSQAVAARTYALSRRKGTGHYDLCDTTACQVYGGKDDEHPASNKAVAETARQVLTHGGKPAFTEFSSSNGGWTVASSIAYQVAKKDPYDTWSGNPNRSWSVKVGAAAIQKAWPKVGKLQRIKVTSRDGNGSWKGRVLKMKLVGKKGSVTVSGDDFRWTFRLKSSWFTFS
ncbi:SpoIID/LytB domain-containing protein [Nocardioides caldifontis]|uniref:SpoIID/LytB domain-containing protein n=1 Tax=Nocardioides caldifontis TaxID=2588938 RepID=UPI0011E00BD3|nr:SpoIID/LytB domain-containing protein [Nocardioides caldifontis]